MPSISVIHAPHDEAFGEKVATALSKSGHPSRRLNGDPMSGDLGLDNTTAIVIWSAATAKLARIHDQAREALARGALIPVAIGGADAPMGFEGVPPVDLSGWGGDENDPRWRFVLEELSLLTRRNLLEDGSVWADPAENPAENIEAANEDHAAVDIDEVAADITAPGQWASHPYNNGADLDDVGDAFDRESEGVIIPTGAPYRSTPKHRQRTRGNRRFYPNQIAMGAGLCLIALTAIGVVAAPFILGEMRDITVAGQEAVQPERTASVTSDAVPPATMAGRDAAHGDAPATLAFVKPIEIPAKEGPLKDQPLLPGDGATTERVREVQPTEEITAANTDQPVSDDTGLQEGASAFVDNDSAPVVIADTAATANEQNDATPSTDVNADEPDTLELPEEANALDALIVAAVTPEVASTTPPGDVAATEESIEALVAEVTGVQASEIAEKAYLGNYFRECVDCPDMATLPAGSFRMGASENESGRHPSEGPAVAVTIPRRFAIGTREVTYDQYDACVADGGCAYKPSGPWGRGKQPVTNVSFADAQNYTAWLSNKTGQNYRLPSEAEWEYAARAGTTTPLAYGSGVTARQANFNGEFVYGGSKSINRQHTVKVASFAPNAFGLFDMHGNVWEWTSDCWAAGHAGAPTDGTPRRNGNCGERVLKGGAWNTGGWRLRSAHRIPKNAGARENDNGFRVARDIE